MPRCGFLTALLLGAAFVLGVPIAAAGTPQQDLAWLNAKRATNDIPGDLALRADWSATCQQHLAYMRATGTVSHAEDPSQPAYTDAGNWAGTHAVLASTEPWTESTFIWETAPLHLAQLLAPQLSEVGLADDGQLVCLTTWPGYLRSAPPTNTVVTYPGNGSTIYASESSDEWPITPAAALGLANPTGPHLFVYAWGPAAETGMTADGQPLAVRSASLRGPNGPVALRWVDAATPTVGQYLPTGAAILIPEHPLDERTSYVASVTFTDGLSRAWGFTTLPGPPALASRDVHISARRVGGGKVRLTIRGRIVDHSTENGAGGIPVALSTAGGATTATTTAGGGFAQTLTVGRRTRTSALVVTLRAADTLTAAYRVPLSRRLRPLGTARSAARASAAAAPHR